jgi:hypothetical protein
MVLSFLIFTSCSPSQSPLVCSALPEEATDIAANPMAEFYLPESFGKASSICNYTGIPKCYPVISEIERDWYPKFWKAADEPSLFGISKAGSSSNTSSLRFTWLRTFQAPVIVRVETANGQTQLVAKELSGQGGYEPGTISREMQRELTPEEIGKLQKFKSKMAGLMATECESGLDGSQWIIERTDGQGYQFVNRWSPKQGAVSDLGHFLLRLTGWQFEEIY